MKLILFLCLLVLAFGFVTAEEANDDNYDNYGDTYLSDLDYADGVEDDFYGYYDNPDNSYYEYYGEYPDDTAGEFADYYEDFPSMDEECYVEDGKVVLSDLTPICDIRISGADEIATNLQGGIDGIYAPISCHNGKPFFKRVNSSALEERVLWFSNTYGDWDISRGDQPEDSLIIMYGGDMEHLSTPLFVENWQITSFLTRSVASWADGDDDEFVPIAAKVTCADGSKVSKKDAAKQGSTGPLLTDEELDAKYQYIYDKYGKSAPSAFTVSNTTVVALFLISGFVAVFVVPYFRGTKKGKGLRNSPPTTFIQLLTLNKKKIADHVK